MIHSMTGFGDARSAKGEKKYIVEIRSLNHRFLDLQTHLPAKFHALETDLKKLIQGKIVRGKVMVFVSVESSDSLEALSVDEEKVRFYVSTLRKLAKKLKLKEELALKDLLAFPDIFRSGETEIDLRKVWTELRPVLEKALAALMASRQKEGKTILRDMEARLKEIERCAAHIQAGAKEFPAKYKEKLDRQVKELTGGLALDEEKLLREIAILADRTDITEEVVRLASHVDLFRKILAEKGDVGKRLDFIIQEMNREANTIASKCSDSSVAREVVEIKSELEKIREQIQNVE